MFFYELGGSGFESSWSHLTFKFRACFEQGVPWHSGNYSVDSLWNTYVTWQEHTGKVNDVGLVFSLLTLNIFHTFISVFIADLELHLRCLDGLWIRFCTKFISSKLRNFTRNENKNELYNILIIFSNILTTISKTLVSKKNFLDLANIFYSGCCRSYIQSQLLVHYGKHLTLRCLVWNCYHTKTNIL